MSARLATLPETLVSGDGTRMVTAAQWQEKRRPEVLELFREHVYGRAQEAPPLSFNTVVREGLMDGTAVRKQVEITFAGPYGRGVIRLLLFVPAGVAKPVPAFLLINNRSADETDPDQTAGSSFWPARAIVQRGYAAAVFHVEDLDPDYDDGYRNGVHGVFEAPDRARPANAWGTIAAWAWGASRVMDYLAADADIDASRVAVAGHSRAGKTALWAGAVDERFAMVISNNSGSTGAAIARGKRGETIADINARFPHWFNGNYKRFGGREDELPVDQHMLLGLIAPRLLYVTSASEDEWADPESEFLSLQLADPVYGLFGLPGMGDCAFPEPQSVIHTAGRGYHLRAGKHDLTEYDWHCFMDFADKQL